jgi:UDP-glucose 4-epimerase
VFNVGSDRPISVAALADLVIRTLGSASEKRLLPYSEAYPSGFEDLKQRQPDLSRVRSAVGFQPRITLEQTIRDVGAALSQGAAR